MRILAIETSTKQGSVALLDGATLIGEQLLSDQQRTAQSLAPALAGLFAQVQWTPRSIDLVAVTSGPGSFTGLRIATTSAKTFAYAADAQVIALNTLDVLVEQLAEDVTDACAVMDAQRQQLFAARYVRRNQRWEVVAPCQIVHRHALGPLLATGTVLTGPVLHRLDPSLYDDHPRADSSRWLPRAGTVGRLGRAAHLAGRRDELLQLQPQYYRPSYAEEKKPN